jgi:tetratricopeptide (TPR) repeat protein
VAEPRDKTEPAADEEPSEADDPGASGPAGAPTATEEIREQNRRARRAAAAKRRTKREQEREKAVAVGLDAGEMVDDALARSTDRLLKWVKRHFNVLQWAIVAMIAGYIGWEIYKWRSEKTAAKATDALMAAVVASQKTEASGLDQAIKGYKDVAESRRGTTTAALAKTGLAGALYRQGKYADAAKLYEELYASDLAKMDPDVKGRSLEGLGLSLEAKGDKDGAMKRYRDLENAEISGFRELGLYHQARLLNAKGDKAKAKELLLKVLEKYKEKPEAFVAQAAKSLLSAIDPKAVPTPSADDALRKALEEFGKSLPEGVKMPMPGGPAPMQEAPAPPP